MVGFILYNGSCILSEIEYHENIAKRYLEENNLLEKFHCSKYRNAIDYMVFEQRAIKVGCNIGGYKVLTFDDALISKQQWKFVDEYHMKGYRIDYVKRP